MNQRFNMNRRFNRDQDSAKIVDLMYYGTYDIMAQWLSWLERRPVTAKVVGSSPIWVAHNLHITQCELVNGVLAQLGEHLPYKQRVIGSSPIGPIYFKV